jgi:hypothetical protein
VLAEHETEISRVHQRFNGLTTPRFGEAVALDYAQDLPPAPRCPL